MSHICSDPYDEAFLEFLHSKWLKEHGNESSSDSSSSGGDYSRLTEAEKRFLMRHPQVIKNFMITQEKLVKQLKISRTAQWRGRCGKTCLLECSQHAFRKCKSGKRVR